MRAKERNSWLCRACHANAFGGCICVCRKHACRSGGQPEAGQSAHTTALGVENVKSGFVVFVVGSRCFADSCQLFIRPLVHVIRCSVVRGYRSNVPVDSSGQKEGRLKWYVARVLGGESSLRADFNGPDSGPQFCTKPKATYYGLVSVWSQILAQKMGPFCATELQPNFW